MTGKRFGGEEEIYLEMFSAEYFTENSIFYYLERVTDILIEVTQIDESLMFNLFHCFGLMICIPLHRQAHKNHIFLFLSR